MTHFRIVFLCDDGVGEERLFEAERMEVAGSDEPLCLFSGTEMVYQAAAGSWREGMRVFVNVDLEQLKADLEKS